MNEKLEQLKNWTGNHKILAMVTGASIALAGLAGLHKTQIAATNLKSKIEQLHTTKAKTGEATESTIEATIHDAIVKNFKKHDLAFIDGEYKHYRVLYIKDPAAYVEKAIQMDLKQPLTKTETEYLESQINENITETKVYEKCNNNNPEANYRQVKPAIRGIFYIPLTTLRAPADELVTYCNDRRIAAEQLISLQRIPDPAGGKILNWTAGNRILAEKLRNAKLKGRTKKMQTMADIVEGEAKRKVLLKLDNVVPGVFENATNFKTITEIGTEVLEEVNNRTAREISKDINNEFSKGT